MARWYNDEEKGDCSARRTICMALRAEARGVEEKRETAPENSRKEKPDRLARRQVDKQVEPFYESSSYNDYFIRFVLVVWRGCSILGGAAVVDHTTAVLCSRSDQISTAGTEGAAGVGSRWSTESAAVVGLAAGW